MKYKKDSVQCPTIWLFKMPDTWDLVAFESLCRQHPSFICGYIFSTNQVRQLNFGNFACSSDGNFTIVHIYFTVAESNRSTRARMPL